MGKCKLRQKKQIDFSRLDWPRISWRSEFWLAVFPFLFGIVQFLYPSVFNNDWYQTYRIPIAILFILSPAIPPLFVWFIQSIIILYRRVYQFPYLYDNFFILSQEFKDFKQNVFEWIGKTSDQRVFDILSTSFNQKLYITIEKKSRSRLKKGDMVVVIDKEDAMTMGLFEIVQIRSSDYIAEARSGIDAVWLGYVKAQGNIIALPHMAAVYIPQGGQNE